MAGMVVGEEPDVVAAAVAADFNLYQFCGRRAATNSQPSTASQFGKLEIALFIDFVRK